MKPRAVTPIYASALAILLLVALPAAAEDVARIKNAGDALVFYPSQEAEWYALTVNGPCNYEYRTRSEGGELVFELPKAAMDGSYTFSLDTKPRIDPEIMEILRKARATGNNEIVRDLCRDGRLPDPPGNQSGGFTVIEGKIVLDTTPEAKRKDNDEGEKAAALSLDSAAPGDADLATGFRAATPEFVLASADTSTRGGRPGECVWARMKPGAGVAER